MQTIYAPTIGFPEAFGSEIVLNSRSPQVKEVTPTFYTAEGQPVVGRKVQLQPAEIRFVPIENLIPEEHRGRSRWGGLALSFSGQPREVWAQIAYHGARKAGAVDVTFSVLREHGSNVQEAVWWTPNHGVTVFALGNSSDTPIRVNLQHSDGKSQDVYIAPFATEYLRRHANFSDTNHKPAGMGESVKLTTSGPPGSLRAAGFVASADGGFTSSIRFYDPQTVVQPNLFATQFRVKNAVPRMVLKNTSATDISARPRFLPSAGTSGDLVELPSVTLGPQEVVEVDLDSLVATAAGRADLDVVSVEVMNSGPSGSLIGALYSTDAPTGTVYDVPLRDSGPIRNSTGAYPWRVGGGYSTNVSITNVGHSPTQFTVNIKHKGGVYTLDPRELAVGETATFDLKKIRDEGIPDRNGNVIPLSVNEGQFRWSVHDGDDLSRLIGRAEVVNASRRTSSSYSCLCDCPDSFYDGDFSPRAFGVPLGRSFAQVLVTKRTRDCAGNMHGPYQAWASWAVDAASVTSMSMVSTGTAKADGLAEGESSISAGIQGTVYVWNGNGCYSYPGYTNPGGNVTVMPRITGLSVRYIDETTQGREVKECGLFEVIVRYTTGTTPSTHTIELIDLIELDAVFVSRSVTETGRSSNMVRYEATLRYRMKNRLSGSDPAHTGQTTYLAELVWDDIGRRRRCEDGVSCISVRNTIPGTGPCP